MILKNIIETTTPDTIRKQGSAAVIEHFKFKYSETPVEHWIAETTKEGIYEVKILKNR